APASGQQLLYGVTGTDADGLFGSTVASAGDVNADGTPDLLVGANNEGVPGAAWGAARVLSGKGGATLRTWTGTAATDAFGSAVAGVGDVNKDGFADVIVGACLANGNGSNAGRAFVYSGATGAILFDLAPAPAKSMFGYAVAGLGDLDGDTWPDFAVGAPGYFQVGAPIGRVFVFSGRTGAQLDVVVGSTAMTDFGSAIDDAGDVNGDGRHDLVIGEPYGSVGGRFEVRSGASLGTTLFAAAGNAGEDFGYSVSGAGDVNHDGFADVIAGGYFADAAAGVARIYLGPSGAPGWVFHGDAAADHFGADVEDLGDVDKDGWADVAVSGYQSAFSASLPGYVRVFSGRTGLVLYATILGPQGGSVFGVDMAGAGDVNGDGWVDLAVGAQHYDGPAGEDIGRVEVYEVLQHATNVGFGGPGAAKLSMYGSPLDDFGQMDLKLTDAKANAPAWIIASPSTGFLTFKGGVLVPDLGLSVIVPLVTNGAGQITVPGILGGFGPASVVIQYVIKDAGQPFGYAMSNAVAPFFMP
ncbi:MAG TPA: FG-GAP-like repeat-containing protein, partial [Planctomycetota bacterium]|nr:FG-GAP-like repeat-containing protein [Planctomycetota bacterium]